MKIFKVHNTYSRFTQFLKVMFMVALAATSTSIAGIPSLNLRSLESFVIIAGSTVTGIPPVSIKGNVGLSPAAGSFIVGFDGSNVDGILYVVDASGPAGSVQDATLLQTAKSDLTTAYNDAANRTPVPTGTFLNPGAGNMGGMNLAAGLYKFTGAADITGADLTLTGSATDVWIFQIGTSLNIGSDTKIILAGGAQASNIFWQVGTSATLGTYSVFKGTILADQSISLGTGASMDGRALAFTGAVTMSSGVTTNKAVLAPFFTVNPQQLNFGNVDNGFSKKDTLRVTNTGGADLIISNITTSDTVFKMNATTATITPGSTQEFYVTFTPRVNGTKSGNIIFTHNAAKPLDTVTISGTGTSPFFSGTPLILSFGDVRNGTTKRDSVTVTNTGTSNLIISNVSSSNSVFTVTPTIDTITPGSSKKFYVTFAPTVDGIRSGNIIFTHNAAKPKDTVTVTGTGVSPFFTVNKSALVFGNVRNGLTKQDSVTVTNTGTSNLIITSVTSSNTVFTVSPSTGTILPGATQKFFVTFSPLVDGAQSGNLVFNHNALKPKDTVTMTGTGVSPVFTANPTTLNFGNVKDGTTKRDSITVTNTGTGDLVITSVTSSNVLFTVTPTTGTIIPGGTQKFYITFAPLVDGLQNGIITFNHNAATPTSVITVSGTGVSPLFSVNPTILNFGNVRNGTTKRDSVTVTNSGTGDLIISGVTSSNPLFTVTPATGTITPGGTQKFYITFAPLVDGLQSGTITFNHNAAIPTNVITVSGTGVSPLFSVNPTSLNYGNVRNGTVKRDSVTVTNSGTSDLIITSVTSSNPLFTITPTTGTITPGSSQKFYITFAPIVDGLQNGNITFNHNAAIPTNVVTVSGTGVSPLFSANPVSLNFGNVRNGTTKKDSVTITNTGTSDLIISSISSSNPLFIVTPTTGTIAPGGTQKFYITFAPLVDGFQTGNITFNHNAATPTNIITVSGTGVSPQFSSNPTFVNFGNVRNGTTKKDSVTITNNGTSDLVITNVTSSNPLFSVSSTTGTIAPGASQKFYISFAPLADGFQSGNITFNHNAATPTTVIIVTGTGVSPRFSVNRGLDFGNVKLGVSKTDSITITNTGTDNLDITNVTIANMYFKVTPHSGVITPGSSQKFYVTFTPLVVGLQSDYVYFNHNAGYYTDIVDVRGTGVASKFSVGPTALNFGNVKIGTSKTDSILVTNSGGDDLIISSISSSNGVFTVTPSNGTILPGSYQKFYITFSPTVIGQQNGTIYFYNNTGDGPGIVNVTGNGVNTDILPKFSSNIVDLDFGNVFIGSTKQKSVMVTNIGVTDLVISTITSSDPHYTITPTFGTITPGSSKEFFITFAPNVVGRVNATVLFTHNAGTNTINVTGNGIDTIQIITIKAARALPIGTSFVTEGIITRTLGSYTRIQDSTGGLTLLQESGVFFQQVLSSELQNGDKIRVHGKISEKNNLKVINGSDLTNVLRISRINMLPTPVKVTLAEIANNGEQYESCLIRVDNMTITTDGDNIYQEAKTYQIRDITDKTNTVVIRIGKKEDTYMDGMPIMGTSASFEGVLSQSSACASCGYQLTPVLSTDLSTQPNGVSDATNTSGYTLSDNYPNPFTASTTIQYSIPSSGFVTLKVFNLSGKEVATLVNSFQNAGTYTAAFSIEAGTQSIGSEMYFYRLQVGNFVSSKQMILVK